MDKKFIIQFVVLLVVIFAGLFSIFQPQLLGVQSMLPGGLTPNTTTTGYETATTASVQQLIFIDQNSTGNPELVKSIMTVDVMDEPQERAQGLSNRESLSENQGMIFLFQEAGQYNFIMKQMRFSLDFIWVKDNVIVDLTENVAPDPEGTSDANLKRYSPVNVVNAVIEVNAGYVQKYGLKVGDRIRLEPLQTTQPVAY